MHFKNNDSFSYYYFKLIILKFNKTLIFANRIKINY